MAPNANTFCDFINDGGRGVSRGGHYIVSTHTHTHTRSCTYVRTHTRALTLAELSKLCRRVSSPSELDACLFISRVMHAGLRYYPDTHQGPWFVRVSRNERKGHSPFESETVASYSRESIFLANTASELFERKKNRERERERERERNGEKLSNGEGPWAF